MSIEEAVIAAARVLGSLLVLRWAFVGGVIAVIVDLSDLFMMNLLRLGGVSSYQTFDKWLDQVYLACFLIVALRWPERARRTAVALYLWRLAGFALFEVTAAREVLVLFPNLFEFWFLFVASLRHWRPLREPDAAEVDRGAGNFRPASRARDAGAALGTTFGFSGRSMVLCLGSLLVVKEVQELAIHWFKVFDSFTAVEAVEAVWRWLTGSIR